jgi:hypothetical protein
MVRDSGSDLVFYQAGLVAFWLLQAERYGGADKAEGFALGAGGLGEHRHGQATATLLRTARSSARSTPGQG